MHDSTHSLVIQCLVRWGTVWTQVRLGTGQVIQALSETARMQVRLGCQDASADSTSSTVRHNHHPRMISSVLRLATQGTNLIVRKTLSLSMITPTALSLYDCGKAKAKGRHGASDKVRSQRVDPLATRISTVITPSLVVVPLSSAQHSSVPAGRLTRSPAGGSVLIHLLGAW